MATQRLRLAAICAALITLVFSQRAGKVVADTKLDLLVDPLRLLARGATLWDPNGASGQLQNQGYGYLFPIGPFYLLGHGLGLPPWVVQRAWESALIVTAFLGAVRLARLMGVRSFWPKVAVGLVYALSPRMLSELGSISSELMPVAALPWVMVPLVRGAREGSPRRAAARSGVALLLAGGVNAAATVAILPVPAIWLLTRAPGPRRRRLIGWWVLAVMLACTWWIVPLLTLGRFSPPFLDWIESSGLTTSVTDLLAVLRGVDHWESFLGPGVWPAGWIFVSVPAVVLATGAVAAAGLAGLGRRSVPHANFLRAVLLVGLILITLGHRASAGPPFAADFRTLLDGPLNAFRNIHKFDPVIRLPLAIGVGHWLSLVRVPSVVPVRVGRRSVELAARRVGFVALAAIGVVAIAPAVGGRLMPSARTTVDPSWWKHTADWLAGHGGDGRALVLPGASRPVYVWGSSVDDALQPYAESPWAVRDGIPLAGAGYIRLLDAVEARFAAGQRDDTLAPLLARAGMGYLVVRNDLNEVASGATALPYVHATIADSPGFVRVAAFGPNAGFPNTATQLYDAGARTPRPAVEIYRVAGGRSPVALETAGSTVSATGSADALPALLERGLAPTTPVRFGRDASDLDARTVVVTDGLRRRAANFGHAASASGTMTADQPFLTKRAAQDYLPPHPEVLSTFRYGGGLAGVTASSSGSQAGALQNYSRANGPWSAVDGDPQTAWRSSSIRGAVGQWLQLDLTRATSSRFARVAFADQLGGYPTRIAVRTDAGTVENDVSPSADVQTITLPRGSTQTLRITVVSATRGSRAVGISTLQLPGLSPDRTLVVPVPREPDVLAFDVDPGRRADCLRVAGGTACDPSFPAHGEEDTALDRTFSLPAARTFLVSAAVRLKGSPALDERLDAEQSIKVAATSRQSDDPRARAGAAVDGDPATAWLAGPGDRTPELTLTLPDRTTVHELRLVSGSATAMAAPTRVTVTVGDTAITATVGRDGTVSLPEGAAGRTVRIEILEAALRRSSSSATGASRIVPVGLSEVQINGDANATVGAPVTLGCADGITAVVDGVVVPLRVTATRAQALAGTPVAAAPCGEAAEPLAAGAHRTQLAESLWSLPVSLTLARPGASLAAPDAGTAAVRKWGSTERSVQVRTSRTAVLVVRENFNAGWEARVGGHNLTAVEVDGWQQGFLVPADTVGTVRLRYAPQTTFSAGLIVGAFGVLVVLLLALLRERAREVPPLGDRGVRPWLAVAGLAVAGGMLAGWAGLVIAAVLWRGAVLLRRYGGPPYWLGSALLLVAALIEAAWWQVAGHGVAGTATVQLLTATGVLAVASRAITAPRLRPDKRSSNGRST